MCTWAPGMFISQHPSPTLVSESQPLPPVIHMQDTQGLGSQDKGKVGRHVAQQDMRTATLYLHGPQGDGLLHPGTWCQAPSRTPAPALPAGWSHQGCLAVPCASRLAVQKAP